MDGIESSISPIYDRGSNTTSMQPTLHHLGYARKRCMQGKEEHRAQALLKRSIQLYPSYHRLELTRARHHLVYQNPSLSANAPFIIKYCTLIFFKHEVLRLLPKAVSCDSSMPEKEKSQRALTSMCAWRQIQAVKSSEEFHQVEFPQIAFEELNLLPKRSSTFFSPSRNGQATCHVRTGHLKRRLWNPKA